MKNIQTLTYPLITLFSKVFFAVILFLSLKVQAQDKAAVEDSLFSRTHIVINATGSQSSIGVNSINGPNAPKSGISPGYEAGANLVLNLNKYLGIQIGLNVGEQSYYYAINPSSNSQDIITNQAGYFQIPIDLTARLRLNRTLFIYGGIGFSQRFYLVYKNFSNSSSLGAANTQNFISYKDSISSAAYANLIPRINVGLLIKCKNLNMIKIGLNIDLGNTITYTADYKYNDYKGKNIGSGSFNANGPLIGLNLGYIFTRARK